MWVGGVFLVAGSRSGGVCCPWCCLGADVPSPVPLGVGWGVMLPGSFLDWKMLVGAPFPVGNIVLLSERLNFFVFGCS